MLTGIMKFVLGDTKVCINFSRITDADSHWLLQIQTSWIKKPWMPIREVSGIY